MSYSTTHPRLARRDFLRVGSLVWGGLTCKALTSSRTARAEPFGVSYSGKAKSCILLWLDGGPSHLETFDPKQDMPPETRGPFTSIKSVVPGIELSELLPLTARVTDKIAIIRSVTSPLGEHGIANKYMLTGYQPSAQLEYPSFGSVLAHQNQSAHESKTIPPYVVVPEPRQSMGSGFLGTHFEPFATGGDPASPDFRVRDLDYYPGLDGDRLQRRKRLLAEVEQFADRAAGSLPSIDPGFEQAIRLLSSPATRQAFDLSAEDRTLRERYGQRSFGQGCLLARRLIERGVRLVSVVQTGWDTHNNLKLQLRDGFAGAKVGVGLVPTFDTAFSSLIVDLSERGLLQETLVIAMGEFGRTPKINTSGGRDHWPRVFSVVLAGGGIRGGQVIGASDRVGESPRDLPVTPADLVRVIYNQLGLDPDAELITPQGRPIRINQGGHDIPGLV